MGPILAHADNPLLFGQLLTWVLLFGQMLTWVLLLGHPGAFNLAHTEDFILVHAEAFICFLCFFELVLIEWII